jgi:hypothetical protein
MTLSQIIAKDSKYDKEIPSEGDWYVRIKIENGKIKFFGFEEQQNK